MREITFSDFIGQVRGGFYRGPRRIGTLISVLEKMVQVDEIKVFYPKNLYVDGKDIQIHVFKRDSVMIFEDTETGVNTKVLKYLHIDKLELHHTREDFPLITLTIRFTTGDQIVLSGFDDTNSSWGDSLTNRTIEIFKLLS